MKKVMAGILSFALICGLTACGSGNSETNTAASGGAQTSSQAEAGDQTEAEYVWKAGSVLAADHPYSMGLTKLGELLKEKSNGRIQLDVYPAGSLGGETEMIEQVQMGTLDFLCTATAPLANFTDALLVYDLPYLFRDTAHVYAVEDGEIGQQLLNQVKEDTGIYAVNMWECGFMELANSKREVKTPEDLKGMNIRIMENAIYNSYFTALGANPITMSLTEVFTSLQNGTIDAVTNPIVTIYTSKFHSEANHVSMVNCIYIPSILLMNLELYQSLPEDLQKIVDECCKEAQAYERGLFNELEEKYHQAIQDEGGEISEVDLSVWRDEKLLDEVYRQFVPSLIPQEVVDAIQAVQ